MQTERDFSRETIIDRLRSRRAAGHPIIGVAAGTGIIAKCAEAADADLIFILSTSRSRNLGVPTTVTMGNAIDTTIGIYPEIDNIIERTPIIGGIEGSDGARKRIGKIVDRYRELGFDGIGNFPTLAASPDNLAVRDEVSQGMALEYRLILEAHDRNVFSVAFVYNPDHTATFIEVGADLIIARCGITAGGVFGPPYGELGLDESIAQVNAVVSAARSADPHALVLAEGGPFADDSAIDALYARTAADGLLCESSIERIVVEHAIHDEVKRFKSQPVRTAAVRA